MPPPAIFRPAAGSGTTHSPASSPVVEQTSPSPQPTPLASRQPGSQDRLTGSQTRPPAATSQSSSESQPQVPSGRQADPEPPGEHPPRFGAHSTQVWAAEQTGVGAPQSASSPHSTQAPASSSQTGVAGAACSHCTSPTQNGPQTPTRSGSADEQKRSAGQPLRPGAGEQPSTQRPGAGSQIRPESIPPQSVSCAQPQTP